MKNLELTFLYVVLTANGEKKEYTIVSTSPKEIYNDISHSNNNSLFPSAVHIINNATYTIRAKLDKQLYQLCNTLFQNTTYIKYEGYLPFDDVLERPSFVKKLLVDNNSYVPSNDMEVFLEQFNILKSYYYKTVQFTIKCVRDEFSKEFGQRTFETIYTTDRVELCHFTRGKSNYHRGSVYSSSSNEKVIEITGVNDKNEKIRISSVQYKPFIDQLCTSANHNSRHHEKTIGF